MDRSCYLRGDGRLVPATDDEVIEVEDMLDDKSSLHFSCETGMTVKTTHNGHDLKSDDEIEKQVLKNAPPTGLVQNQQPIFENMSEVLHVAKPDVDITILNIASIFTKCPF
ncbi:hypothetical protein L2E82_43535 [Cichorium intybus]|uniref:Uncharacterized protein n=1 Tax=Cichorium intybus TaxID=13427 RepID=A0ACB8ZNN2_CICIN|nr:hypothetical protein L2E82_43535 [Cichorium intybus]